ncbi:type 1 glutamine amidotransferase domain-containing protein [Schlegelella sp. S2-27]|uniref:Type 1 glutamine amidotransferase domain-containing protein n=1 Tax=Caldimonas mangrovi TaxID=2944811 RepID=A0ABT0YIW6_9BURK|nr:type 1 glutamine amidotransferase domain-containing protein [Caldimonas mangrovi]MCM5678106.1 type 1 glutamine amidotransferase domain-containing protein [Caldimonas mangrovi]
MTRRILIIVTSNDRMGETARPTGLWAEELAAPYFAFVDAGHEVEIASPKGGAAPIDPGSLKPRGENDAVVERFLADETVQRKVKATRRVSELDASGFDAVFFPGGHGTMWDLPGDVGVTRAVESAYAAGKVVAAVCHGPAGLVSARRPDGQPLVAGKRVNAFTDDEERAAGQMDSVPFTLESRLRELGAHFEKAANWQPFAVRDGQLITGQNPQSSAEVARLVLHALQ